MTVAEAAQLVGWQQGLPASFNGSPGAINALETNQKLELTAGLGAYIRNNPALFEQNTVNTANRMFTRDGSPLADTSFSLGEFAVEVGSNANSLVIKPFVTLGQNVSNTAYFLAYILPVAAVAGIAWYVYVKFVKSK